MKNLQAGDLDRVIHLIKPTPKESRFGGPGTEVEYLPENGVKVWANRKDEIAGASEEVEGKRVTAVSLVSFSIRYRSDINPTWRIVEEGGQVYNIVHVAEQGRRQWLVIKAKHHD
ncbi:head-tail adaptor protein [Tellurirhabdus bombi]|uniref:head-tail adaptor protein n=1 Tax=Tellurirhabdus bombi TaxID=2907205 RepID=UPI001F448C31|nr:head-tail adaptor protein [Tellurirhabdus bombi]